MEANHICFPARDTFFRLQRATEPHGGLLHRVVAAEWASGQDQNYAESANSLPPNTPPPVVGRRKGKKKKAQEKPRRGVKLAGDAR